MKAIYTSKTFKGSVLENEILYHETALNLLDASRNAVKHWEKELTTTNRKEFAREQILFFQDAVNLIEKKLKRKNAAA